MSDEQLQAKRAYNREKQREWRERNKDRYNEYQRQYKKDKAEQVKKHTENFYRRLAEKGQAND